MRVLISGLAAPGSKGLPAPFILNAAGCFEPFPVNTGDAGPAKGGPRPAQRGGTCLTWVVQLLLRCGARSHRQLRYAVVTLAD